MLEIIFMVDWLIVWLIDWLNDWLIVWLIYWLIVTGEEEEGEEGSANPNELTNVKQKVTFHYKKSKVFVRFANAFFKARFKGFQKVFHIILPIILPIMKRGVDLRIHEPYYWFSRIH